MKKRSELVELQIHKVSHDRHHSGLIYSQMSSIDLTPLKLQMPSQTTVKSGVVGLM